MDPIFVFCNQIRQECHIEIVRDYQRLNCLRSEMIKSSLMSQILNFL